MNAMAFHFRLLKCKQDKHYHIVSKDGAIISAPFWTWAGGLNVATMVTLDAYNITPPLHRSHLRDEMKIITDRIRDIRDEGFTRIGSPQKRELCIIDSWKAFLTGHSDRASYDSKPGKGSDKLPFICEFVERAGDSRLYGFSTEEANRRLLKDLAKEKAKLLTLEEVELRRFREEMSAA